MNEQRHALITLGSPVASAEVSERLGEVDVHFHVDAGHTTPGVRSRLVAEVFALPELRESHQLRASMPLGDAELLGELRRRCPSHSTRAAGATCLVEASLAAARE